MLRAGQVEDTQPPAVGNAEGDHAGLSHVQQNPEGATPAPTVLSVLCKARAVCMLVQAVAAARALPPWCCLVCVTIGVCVCNIILYVCACCVYSIVVPTCFIRIELLLDCKTMRKCCHVV